MLNYTAVSAERIRDFDNKGYLIIRNALDTDTVAVLEEVSDRLIGSDLQINRQCHPEGFYDGFRNVVALDDAYVPLLTHPEILPLVVHLLGANLQLMTSHLIYKYPDPPGTATSHRVPGWHRDYLQAMMSLGHYSIPRIELKCAYFFTDLSETECGATMVAPGSNLLIEPLEMAPGQADPIGAVEPLLNRGDCLIFENRTWHAGAPNRSGRIRKGIMIGYGYRWVMPMDFRCQSADVLEGLTPLERFLMGESFDDVDAFQPSGGDNPLADWCVEHGVPTARHSGPGNNFICIY